MTEVSLDELGPVDYVVVEFPVGASSFTGEMAAELRALVDSGTIRVIDVLILTKDADGAVEAAELPDGGELGELQVIEAELGNSWPGMTSSTSRLRWSREARPECSSGRTRGRPRRGSGERPGRPLAPVRRGSDLDPRAPIGCEPDDCGVLAQTPHLAWLGRTSIARQGICHHQFVSEQERRLCPDENLADPVAVAALPPRP